MSGRGSETRALGKAARCHCAGRFGTHAQAPTPSSTLLSTAPAAAASRPGAAGEWRHYGDVLRSGGLDRQPVDDAWPLLITGSDPEQTLNTADCAADISKKRVKCSLKR